MTVKLNLTIDEKTAKRIKSYAARKKVSVSKIAEEKFIEVLKSEKKDDSFAEFIKQYSGSIRRPVNIEKERDEYLRKKYGV